MHRAAPAVTLTTLPATSVVLNLPEQLNAEGADMARESDIGVRHDMNVHLRERPGHAAPMDMLPPPPPAIKTVPLRPKPLKAKDSDKDLLHSATVAMQEELKPRFARQLLSPRVQTGLLLGWNAACLLCVLYCSRIMSPLYQELLSLYYQPLLPLLFMLGLWAAAVAVMEGCAIKYEVCFSLEDQKYLISSHQLAQVTLLLSTLVATSCALFCYLCAMSQAVLASYQPPLIYCSLLALLLLPANVVVKDTRLFFGSTLFRVMTPVRSMSWADFLLADILTSLAKSISDSGRAMCHLMYGPLMNPAGQVCEELSWLVPLGLALPYMWRFCQCLRVYMDTGAVPQVFNAIKYSTAFPVIIMIGVQRMVSGGEWLAFYRSIYIACALVNTLYSYYWDVERDWEIAFFSTPKGVRRGWGVRQPLLKSELLYPPALYYYLMLTNLLLRFSWLLRLTSLWNSYLVILGVTMLEGFRRFQWLFVRIEVELRKLQHQRPELGKLVPSHPSPV